jgi:putative GTP pyrophosphokinase
MSDLESARRLWVEEEKRFEEYASLVAERLRLEIQKVGIWFEVTSRAKTTDSLIKKLIKKPNYTYDSLPDKAGVRIVVRYRSELELIVKTVQQTLSCESIDPKYRAADSFGYASIHADFVRLPLDDDAHKSYHVNKFWVELQIRTLAQHLWSELSHDSVYKNDETIKALPEDVKRRVHLMAGQIEVTDREFDRLGKETKSEDAVELLHFLEKTYYTLTSRKPDLELSLLILQTILPLYHASINEVEGRLSGFLSKKGAFLAKRYDQALADEAPPVSSLFFQPEALALFERLSDDQSALRRTWSTHFPDTELQKFANDFGISFL